MPDSPASSDPERDNVLADQTASSDSQLESVEPAPEPADSANVQMSVEERLIEVAYAAAQMAYAPYSGLKVGAAVQTAEGDIHTGCNVENASYGLTTCAERNAIAGMVETGGRLIRRVAVVTDKMGAITPCGACLQVIAEFGGADTEVVIIDESGTAVAVPISNLLPKQFRL